MWAPNLSSFTRPHWYFGVHIFNELLKAVTKKKLFTWYPLNKFQHFLYARDLVDPMKSLTLDNVLSVANSENKSES